MTTTATAQMTTEEHRRELERLNAEIQNLDILHPFGVAKSMLRSRGLPFSLDTIKLLKDPALTEALRQRTRLYNEAVVHHNAIVEAENAAIRERNAARRTAKTYSEMCGKCFTLHPGDDCY